MMSARQRNTDELHQELLDFYSAYKSKAMLFEDYMEMLELYVHEVPKNGWVSLESQQTFLNKIELMSTFAYTMREGNPAAKTLENFEHRLDNLEDEVRDLRKEGLREITDRVNNLEMENLHRQEHSGEEACNSETLTNEIAVFTIPDLEGRLRKVEKFMSSNTFSIKED